MGLLLLLAVLSILSSAHADSLPVTEPLSPSATEFLTTHNLAREAVGVPPLQWNDTLAYWTSSYLRFQSSNMNCKFANLTNLTYGWNQYLVTWTGETPMTDVTPTMAVDYWLEQKDNYIYANNSCVAGGQCWLYTQVVWRNSLELGCAQGNICQGTSLTLCFYNPPGNIAGQWPY